MTLCVLTHKKKILKKRGNIFLCIFRRSLLLVISVQKITYFFKNSQWILCNVHGSYATTNRKWTRQKILEGHSQRNSHRIFINKLQ